MQRRHRLRRSSDFALLHQQGRRFRHPLLMLVIRSNGLPFSRFAFSASRQVGKATRRNRAKRLMRESVRQLQDDIGGGWDCLFIAHRDAAEASLVQIEDAIGRVLERAQVLNDNEHSDMARQPGQGMAGS